jgi:hypothetical protein
MEYLERLVGQHFQYLAKLTNEGICNLVGRAQATEANKFDNEELAQEILNSDRSNGMCLLQNFSLSKSRH